MILLQLPDFAAEMLHPVELVHRKAVHFPARGKGERRMGRPSTADAAIGATGRGGSAAPQRAHVPSRARGARASAALYLTSRSRRSSRLPSDREATLLLTLGLLAGYALVSRVRFEFGNGYVVPEQLLFVPVVLLLPLNQVLLLLAAASVLALVPDIIEGRWHKQTLLGPLADSWFFVGPVLVLAAWAPAEPASLTRGSTCSRSALSCSSISSGR